jgi:hypothetical protein
VRARQTEYNNANVLTNTSKDGLTAGRLCSSANFLTCEGAACVQLRALPCRSMG